MEGVGFAICRDVPFFGDTRDDVGGTVARGQTFEEVQHDVRFRYAFGDLRVDGFRLGAVAPAHLVRADDRLAVRELPFPAATYQKIRRIGQKRSQESL